MRLPDDESALLARLFLQARTHKAWQPEGVGEGQLRQVYELMRWGPTSNNGVPARFVFVTGGAARKRLAEFIHEGNRPKVAGAPVIAVVAYDPEFWRHWRRLSPHKDLERLFGGDPVGSSAEAYRNALLQAGYFVMAARAVGLDVFPLTGFDKDALDTSGLLPGGWRSILLCCLGHGDAARLRPRAGRLAFEDACAML